MNKKAIAILGAIFVLIVGTLGFLIYSKYSNKTDTTVPVQQTAGTPNPPVASTTPVVTAPATTTPTTGLQPVASTTPSGNTYDVVKLTGSQVVSPVMFYNGTGITYFDNRGNLYQANLTPSNGQLTFTGQKQLDIPVKNNITKILWPPKGDDFIAQAADATGKPTWSYFNSAAGTYMDFPPQVESVDWMPNGTQIMYVWVENNKATLNISNPDTTNWKALGDMWENDDSIHISPDGLQVMYYETANTSAVNAINSVTADGKVWSSLVKSGQNMGILWSPDSQKFLFQKKDLATQQYQLWVYNITSSEVKNLGIYSTVDKAVWDSSSNIVYAAVPNTPVAGAGLTQDSFYRVDVQTTDKKQYMLSATTPVDGMNLFLSSTGDKLFFSNAQDGGLYYLSLGQ